MMILIMMAPMVVATIGAAARMRASERFQFNPRGKIFSAVNYVQF
jgi:hypothetical protein